jgi:pyruvate dehydrogenase complex dehydrogenase (E1) component
MPASWWWRRLRASRWRPEGGAHQSIATPLIGMTPGWALRLRAGLRRRARVDRFGQTGDLTDLYRRYRLDPDAIVHATATLFAS